MRGAQFYFIVGLDFFSGACQTLVYPMPLHRPQKNSSAQVIPACAAIVALVTIVAISVFTSSPLADYLQATVAVALIGYLGRSQRP